MTETTGNLNVTSATVAGNLTASAAQALSLGNIQSTGAGMLTLNAGTTINNALAAGSHATTGGELILNAYGDIGATANLLETDVAQLSFHTHNDGNVYLNNAGTLTLAASQANTIILTAGNTLQITGAVSGNTLNFATTNNNGSILLDADVAAANSLTLNASGAISQTAGVLFANLLSLQTTTGDVGASSNPLQINANQLTLAVSGDAFLQQANAISLNGITVSGALNLTGNGALINNGSLNANSAMLNTTGNGDIQFAQNATVTGLLALNANGSGNILTNNNASLATGSLSVQSGNGNVTLDGSFGSVSGVTGGNLTLSSAGDLKVSAGGLQGNAVELTTHGTGDIVLDGTVKGQTVTLASVNAIRTDDSSIVNISATDSDSLQAQTIIGSLLHPINIQASSGKTEIRANGALNGISVDLIGLFAGGKIDLLNTPPGEVIVNGVIVSPLLTDNNNNDNLNDLGQIPLLGGISDIYSPVRINYLMHQTVDATGIFTPDDVIFGKLFNAVQNQSDPDSGTPPNTSSVETPPAATVSPVPTETIPPAFDNDKAQAELKAFSRNITDKTIKR